MADHALRRADELLTELVELIETARAVPMSASCVVPREHVLDLLDDLREVMPPEMDQARAVIAQRDSMLDEARDSLIRARAEADVLTSEARTQASEQASAVLDDARRHGGELVAEAQTRAREILDAGRAEHAQLVSSAGVHQAATVAAERLRAQADEYDAGVRDEAERYAASMTQESRRYAERMRNDSDAYADRTLADLLEVLTRSVRTAEQGRLALARRRAETQPESDQVATERTELAEPFELAETVDQLDGDPAPPPDKPDQDKPDQDELDQDELDQDELDQDELDRSELDGAPAESQRSADGPAPADRDLDRTESDGPSSRAVDAPRDGTEPSE